MHARPISLILSRTLEWLWPHRLALGKPALLDGDPGLGKSYIALDLCARLSSGRAFPDGSGGGAAANAVILSAEDNDGDTLAPRLRALGADPARVFVWPSDRPLPRLPSQLRLLDETLRQTGARLAVIDPIMAFLDASVCIGSDPSVRRVLEPLADLAEKHRCTLLLVRHLNKKVGGPALYRGSGSIAFAANCRFGWLAARDPQQPDRRVFAQLKNNLAPAVPSLAYTLETQPDGPALLRWEGVSPWTQDDLLARRRPGPGPESGRDRPRARAARFLAEFLQPGPRTTRELRAAARAERVSRSTLLRAKSELEVRCERVWHRGQLINFWLLPGQDLPQPFRRPIADLDRLLQAVEQPLAAGSAPSHSPLTTDN